MISLKSPNLQNAWLEILKTIFSKGQDVKSASNLVKELLNLFVEIENSHELDHPEYFRLFDKKVYKQVLSIYRFGGRKYRGYNYGERICNEDDFNQVEKVVHILSQDPLSRSATIVLSRPQKDQFHLPCIMDINFKIRNEQLLMTLIFKSCDISKKFVPDIFSLGRIHLEISQKLQIARGPIHAFIMSAQIHEEDFNLIKRFIDKPLKFTSYPNQDVIDNWDKEAITLDTKIINPDHYVNIESGYERFLKFTKKILNNYPISFYHKCLDIDCGTGIVSKELKNFSKFIYGLDVSPKMIEEARKKIRGPKFILGNAIDIPFEDKFFGVVASRGILISHVGRIYVEKYLSEVSRVLDHKGYFIFDYLMNVDKKEKKIKRKKAIFSRKDMIASLEKFGFRIIESEGNESNRINSCFCIKQ